MRETVVTALCKTTKTPSRRTTATSASASTRTAKVKLLKAADRQTTRETVSAMTRTTTQPATTMRATVVTALCKTTRTLSRITTATSACASTLRPRYELINITVPAAPQEENRIASNG